MQLWLYRLKALAVILVIAAGLSAGLHVRVPSGPRSLHDVAAYGTLDAVKALLATKAGRAQINQKKRFCRGTPLYLSQMSHEVIELLLESGADPTISDRLDITPLHKAALLGSQRISKLLIEYGARVNGVVTARNQYSPLHMAVIEHRGYPRFYPENTIWLLINYGADVDARNKNGKSPLQMASNALRPVLEQFANERLKAIRGWAEQLQYHCGLSADVVNHEILRMALTDNQRRRLDAIESQPGIHA